MSVAKPGSSKGTDRFKSLYQLLVALSRAKGLEDVYEAALTSLLETTAADRAAILLFDPDGIIRCKASRGMSQEYRDAAGHSPWPAGALDAQIVVVPDLLADENFAPFHGALRQEGIRGAAFLPLALDAGVFGKLGLYYDEPYECTREELEMASAIAAHVGLATVRTRAEAGRERSERHLAAIVESSDDAIVSKDLNGIITSWNRGAARIFGYTAEEAIGKPVAILSSPDRVDEMPRILAEISAGNRVDHIETRRRRKDGQIIDVSLTVSPVRNGEGKIIGASKIARDISYRKHADQERTLLLAREHEARRTAELLNLVAPRLAAQLDTRKLAQEVTDIATTLVGAEFGAFFYNVLDEKCEAYMLYTLPGVPAEVFNEFPVQRCTELFAPFFRGEAVVRCDDVKLDPRYESNPPHFGTPAGDIPVRSYLALPVISRSGEVMGGLFFGHSVPGKFTATHEAIVAGIAAQAAIAMDNAHLFERANWVQTELKRSNEELRRANQDLEVFAYSASHDLQEPLRTIAISAQIMKRNCGGQLQEKDAAFLESILTASQRMAVLLEDLLSYTKATRFEEGPAPSVDSAAVLMHVLESMRATIEAAGATVTFDELPRVAIHDSRLTQLFQNLISNAIKYRNQEAPQVHVAAVTKDGWCVFSVTDNGIGIEPQYAEQIFGLFKRLHSRDEFPGSGIGLAICQRVVEQYGGRIWLERSAPGAGSTFCFSLPSRSG